jgi:hypothetical protein
VVVEAEMVEVEEMAAVAETSRQIVGNDLGFPTLAISEHRLAGFNGSDGIDVVFISVNPAHPGSIAYLSIKFVRKRRDKE